MCYIYVTQVLMYGSCCDVAMPYFEGGRIDSDVCFFKLLIPNEESIISIPSRALVPLTVMMLMVAPVDWR